MIYKNKTKKTCRNRKMWQKHWVQSIWCLHVTVRHAHQVSRLRASSSLWEQARPTWKEKTQYFQDFSCFQSSSPDHKPESFVESWHVLSTRTDLFFVVSLTTSQLDEERELLWHQSSITETDRIDHYTEPVLTIYSDRQHITSVFRHKVINQSLFNLVGLLVTPVEWVH